MNVSYIYSSLSGNTKRLAEMLHEKTKNSRLVNINEYESHDADVYVLCCWIDKALPDKKTLDMVDEFNGKDVLVIATLGASPQSDHASDCIANISEKYSNANLKGVKMIQGSISNAVIEKFKTLPADHPHALSDEKMNRYESLRGRPNQVDAQLAYEFIEEFIEVNNA